MEQIKGTDMVVTIKMHQQMTGGDGWALLSRYEGLARPAEKITLRPDEKKV